MSQTGFPTSKSKTMRRCISTHEIFPPNKIISLMLDLAQPRHFSSSWVKALTCFPPVNRHFTRGKWRIKYRYLGFIILFILPHMAAWRHVWSNTATRLPTIDILPRINSQHNIKHHTTVSPFSPCSRPQKIQKLCPFMDIRLRLRNW